MSSVFYSFEVTSEKRKYILTDKLNIMVPVDDNILIFNVPMDYLLICQIPDSGN